MREVERRRELRTGPSAAETAGPGQWRLLGSPALCSCLLRKGCPVYFGRWLWREGQPHWDLRLWLGSGHQACCQAGACSCRPAMPMLSKLRPGGLRRSARCPSQEEKRLSGRCVHGATFALAGAGTLSWRDFHLCRAAAAAPDVSFAPAHRGRCRKDGGSDRRLSGAGCGAQPGRPMPAQGLVDPRDTVGMAPLGRDSWAIRAAVRPALVSARQASAVRERSRQGQHQGGM